MVEFTKILGMHFIFVLLLLTSGRSLGLQCYMYQGNKTRTEQCSPTENACSLVWEYSPFINDLHGGCFTNNDCNSTVCHVSRGGILPGCCCNVDFCNVITNLDPSVTPNLPPTFSPMTSNNGVHCAEYFCVDGTCTSGHETCSSGGCMASYMLTGDHYDLFHLGCRITEDNCSDNCFLDTTLGTSYIMCSCCSDNCNFPDNIQFSDSSRITHFVESPACRSLNCQHVCLTYRDGHPAECHCRRGFRLAPNNRSCIDIDECTTGGHSCHSTAKCENKDGSFICVCPPGQKFAEDGTCVDIEFGCSNNLHNCPPGEEDCQQIQPCEVARDHIPACVLTVDQDLRITTSGCVTQNLDGGDCQNSSCTVLHFLIQTMGGAIFRCCCLESRCTEKFNASLFSAPLTIPVRSSTTARSTSETTDLVGTPTDPVSSVATAAIASTVTAVLVLVVAAVLAALLYCCLLRIRKRKTGLPRVTTMEVEDQLHPSFLSRILENTKECVGKGRFGNVYRVQTTDRAYPIVAIKEYKDQEYRDGGSLATEAEMMAQLMHKNIVKYLDHSTHQQLLVMEYVEGGSLLSNLRSGRVFTFEEAIRIAKSFMEGLAYLHRMSVAHRDIKSSNMLINGSSCKVADFGLAVSFAGRAETDTRNTQTQVGTPRYMAVEIIEGQIDSVCEHSTFAAIDVYAAALVMWEVLTRTTPPSTSQNIQIVSYKPPFSDIRHEFLVHNPSVQDMMELYREPTNRPVIPAYFFTSYSHECFANLIQDMWSVNPKSRPTSLFCVEKLSALMPATQPIGNGVLEQEHNEPNFTNNNTRRHGGTSDPRENTHTETTV